MKVNYTRNHQRSTITISDRLIETWELTQEPGANAKNAIQDYAETLSDSYLSMFPTLTAAVESYMLQDIEEAFRACQ